MVNKFLINFTILIVSFSDTAVGIKESVRSAVKICEEIRKDDGWLDSVAESAFFGKNLLRNIKVIESALPDLCIHPSETVGKICQTTKETIARAQAHARHNLNSHVFYHVLLLKLIDLLNIHSGLLLGENNSDDISEFNIDNFLSFTQGSRAEKVLVLQNKLIDLFTSNKSPEEVLKIYNEIHYNELVNFSAPEWLYEYSRRLINSNHCPIHTVDELNEEDINYAMSRQVALIGVVTKPIKFDGRSAGPWEFADHDFTCHIKIIKNNANEMVNKYIINFAEKHQINKAIYLTDLCSKRPKQLPVGPWLPLQQFYDAISAVDDSTLKKKLNLGFFVANHENYRLFEDLKRYRGKTSYEDKNETGRDAHRWRQPNDLSNLLPTEIDRNDSDSIENYVLDVEKTFCTFRTNWFSQKFQEFSSEDKAIYSLLLNHSASYWWF